VLEASILEALSKVPGELVPGYFTGLDSAGKPKRVRIFWLPEHTPPGVRANYSRRRLRAPQITQRSSTDVCLCRHPRDRHEGRGRNRHCVGSGIEVGVHSGCLCRSFCKSVSL
jgi:hypothetical protein